MAIDKGVPVPTLSNSPNGPAQITALAEWVDDHGVIEELTTAQRDQLPASARWPGRTLWERLTPAVRRLVTWDSGVQQWREELAARLHAAQHDLAGADPLPVTVQVLQLARGASSVQLQVDGDRAAAAGTVTLPAGWGSAHVLFTAAGELASERDADDVARVFLRMSGESDAQALSVRPPRGGSVAGGAKAVPFTLVHRFTLTAAPAASAASVGWTVGGGDASVGSRLSIRNCNVAATVARVT